jgi:hypothetical protein
MATEASSKLRDFDDKIDAALQQSIRAMGGLLDARRASKDAAQEAMEVVRTQLAAARAEQAATKRVLEVLRAEAWPIAIYVCFRHGDAAKGWMEAWQGLQQWATDHGSAAFHRLA